MIPEKEPMSTRSTANYAELANEYLDRIPILSIEDARTAANALRRLMARSGPPSSPVRPLTGRIEVIDSVNSIGELLENPDMYAPNERQETFKAIVRERIASKVRELQRLTPSGIEESQTRQTQRHQQAEQYQRMVANRVPPRSGSPAHTVPYEEALAEHFGVGRRHDAGPNQQAGFPEIRIITDRRTALETVRGNGQMIMFLSNELKDDEEVLLEAGGNYDMAFLSASDRLKNDRTFILRFAQRNGLVLQWVGPVFQDDKEIVVAALQQNRRAYWYVSQGLQHDPDVLRAAGR